MRHSLPYRMLRKRPYPVPHDLNGQCGTVLGAIGGASDLLLAMSDMTRDGLANKALAGASSPDLPEIRQGLQKNPQESESRPSRKPCANATICCLLSLPICKVFATRILKPSVLVSHLKVMTSLKR